MCMLDDKLPRRFTNVYTSCVFVIHNNSAGIYLFRVNNGNTRTMREIILMSTKIPERQQVVLVS